MTQHGSLFPAYASSEGIAQSTIKSEDASQPDWLSNPSFSEQTLSLIQQAKRCPTPTDVINEDVKAKRLDLRKDSDRDFSSESSEEDAARRSKAKKKKKKRHKEKSKKHKHKRERDYSKDGISTEPPAKKADSLVHIESGKVFVEEIAGLQAEHAYRIDRKKDESNLMYGELYKMHVAKYRCLRHVLLGSDERYDKKSKGSRKRDARYFARENLRALHLEGKAVHCRSSDTASNETDGFMLLSDDIAKTEEKEEVDQLGVFDAATTAYLQGKAPQQADEGEDKPIFCPSGVQKRNEDFSRRLREDPHDIDLWLEYVAFQDHLISFSGNDPEPKAVVSEKQNRALIEMKDSVLRKALQKNPASIQLKLAQLQICRDFWDSEQTMNEWKEFVFKNPWNPIIWVHYLSFIQSKFSSFTVNGTVKIYAKCLQTLRTLQEGQMKSHKAHPHTTEYMIAIFAQMCQFLVQAGHTERAIAFYQALLEFTLFKPEILSEASAQEEEEFLEAYWDSPAPRLGDDGAVGWGQWMEKKGDLEPVQLWYNKGHDEKTEEDILKQPNALTKVWVALETSRESRHWLPWRSNISLGESEEDCEDPERLVLFDDVSSCLFNLRSSEHKFQLLCCFLRSFGVEVHHGISTRNPLMHVFPKGNTVLGDSFQESDVHLLTSQGFLDSINYEHLDKFVENVITQSAVLFPCQLQTKLWLILLDYKVRILCCLKGGLSKKEFKAKVKELGRYFKELLKQEQNRNNLLVWERYAVFEWHHGSRESARKVLDMALTMSEGTNHNERSQRCALLKLYRCFIELELGFRDKLSLSDFGSRDGISAEIKERVLHLLLCLCRVLKYVPLNSAKSLSNPVNILKARKSFEDERHSLLEEYSNLAISVVDWELLSYAGEPLLHWIQCYAFFSYLTKGFSSASSIYDEVLASLNPLPPHADIPEWDASLMYREKVQEMLTQQSIEFQVFHFCVSVSSRAPLQSALNLALERYPDSSFLWRLQLDVESKAGAISKLRACLHKLAQQSQGPCVWLHAVLAEIRRMHKVKMVMGDLGTQGNPLVMETGVTNQLRAWFERALSSPEGEHCLLLWRLYLHTEVSVGKLGRAKGVFYRAAQTCPWAKALYLDYVYCGLGNIQEMTDLMTEKELRLRTPVEELNLLTASAQAVALATIEETSVGADGNDLMDPQDATESVVCDTLA